MNSSASDPCLTVVDENYSFTPEILDLPAQPGPAACTCPILSHLAEVHRELAGVHTGQVATYIPELAKADPDWFGICVVTTNGGVYEVGDSSVPFSIQSLSKPFVYGLALEDRGRAEVMEKIGVEPTGDAFNSISLDPETGRPRNPMINAGAITATALVEGRTSRMKLDRIVDMFGRYAGRSLEIDQAVYRSESDTGHRNRAIGYMLRNAGILTEDPAAALDLYFQQCAISATCRELAIMAATLANRGVNPLTGAQAIRGEYVESVLGVMGTCGMYDYAGEWLHDVGLPAKSGVSGGVIAVLPGQLGIGVFSPRLDRHGNSIRGVRTCNALSRHWDLHLFNRPGTGRSVIRVRSSAAELSSNRLWNPAEAAILREHGSRILVYQLQGHLLFASTELLVREIVGHDDGVDYIILDFKRVLSVNESACRLLAPLLAEYHASGRTIILTHADHLTHLGRFLRRILGARADEILQLSPDNDTALEACENRLLARLRPPATSPQNIVLKDFDLCRGLDAAELTALGQILRRRSYAAGETVIHAGDDARELFLLARGSVRVVIDLPEGRSKRLASFSAGMAFGEMAALDRAPRSATVIADTDTLCDILPLSAFDRLAVTHPGIKIKLLENLARGLSAKLRRANRELTVLE